MRVGRFGTGSAPAGISLGAMPNAGHADDGAGGNGPGDEAATATAASWGSRYGDDPETSLETDCCGATAATRAGVPSGDTAVTDATEVTPAWKGHGRQEAASGSRTTNMAPGCASPTVTVPPWATTSSRTMARPRPVPPPGRPRCSSRRTNRSKTRSRSAAAMPGPVVDHDELGPSTGGRHRHGHLARRRTARRCPAGSSRRERARRGHRARRRVERVDCGWAPPPSTAGPAPRPPRRRGRPDRARPDGCRRWFGPGAAGRRRGPACAAPERGRRRRRPASPPGRDAPGRPRGPLGCWRAGCAARARRRRRTGPGGHGRRRGARPSR